jgi:hypothetical protein
MSGGGLFFLQESSLKARDRHLKSNQSNQTLLRDIAHQEAAWVKERVKLENELTFARAQLKFFEEEVRDFLLCGPS